MKDLESLRKEINSIDNQLVALLEKRMGVSKEIGKVKKQNNLPIENLQREQDILNELKTKTTEETSSYIEEIYKTIFKVSKDYQNK